MLEEGGQYASQKFKIKESCVQFPGAGTQSSPPVEVDALRHP